MTQQTGVPTMCQAGPKSDRNGSWQGSKLQETLTTWLRGDSSRLESLPGGVSFDFLPVFWGASSDTNERTKDSNPAKTSPK